MTTPVDTVRGFYEAVSCSDVRAILSLLDAQVQWTEAERFPYYGGTWQEPQAVVDNLFKPLFSEWDGFSVKPHEFIARGDRVVSLGTVSGKFKKTGRSFPAPFAHVWTVHGDKIASSTCTPTPPRCSRR
jgi:ketosteroid isomerase-like protein